MRLSNAGTSGQILGFTKGSTMAKPSQELMERAALYQIVYDLRTSLESAIELAEADLKSYTDKKRLEEIAENAKKAIAEIPEPLECMDNVDALALEALSYSLDEGWPGVKGGKKAERGSAAFIFGQIAAAVADGFRYSIHQSIYEAADKTKEIIEKACDDFAKTLEINHPD